MNSSGNGTSNLDLAHHPYVIKSEEIAERKFFGLGYEFFTHMKKYKNNIAQYNFEENTQETFDEVLQKCVRTAIKLKTKNLGDDPVIGICVANPHSKTCIPLIAATFLGYTVATFDGSVPASDTSLLLKKIMPAIMFVDKQSVPMMESAQELSGGSFELIVFGKDEKHSMFSEYIVEQDTDEKIFEPVRIESDKKTALIMYSSGTTGLSKGTCIPHNALLYTASNVSYLQSLSTESVVFYLTNINWISSIVLMSAAILSGAARVICPLSETWQAIHKYKVTTISVAPYGASLLVTIPKPETLKTDSVKSLFTQGTKLSSGVRSQLQKLFPKTLITQGYGTTESVSYVLMFQLNNKEHHYLAEKKPDSIGMPIPGFWYKIVDPDSGKIMGPNEVGELRLKCHFIVMSGYLNQDSSSEFDSEGWLKTGDLIYYDEDQCFFFAGRNKEMLKYRGIHIQPQKLETILDAHPAVEKSVVIGISKDEEGDHPMGLVVLKKGQKGVSSRDIELFVEKQVEERWRLRAGVKIVDSFPYTSTGKPRRNILKKLVESGQI